MSISGLFQISFAYLNTRRILTRRTHLICHFARFAVKIAEWGQGATVRSTDPLCHAHAHQFLKKLDKNLTVNGSTVRSTDLPLRGFRGRAPEKIELSF